MNWLLIDTSCPRAVVALCVGERLAAHRYLSETKQHSEFLSPAVHEVLSEANLEMDDLDGVAVGKGPGSFIGVRIAMAFAKGLCVALEIPLVGVGTLSSLANAPSLPAGVGAAVIDARRGEYYAQTFLRAAQGACLPKDAPHLIPAGELTNLAEKSDFLVGTSLTELASSTSSERIAPTDGPSAEGFVSAFLAHVARFAEIVDETESLVPEYVRDPDAKPMPT